MPIPWHELRQSGNRQGGHSGEEIGDPGVVRETLLEAGQAAV